MMWMALAFIVIVSALVLVSIHYGRTLEEKENAENENKIKEDYDYNGDINSSEYDRMCERLSSIKKSLPLHGNGRKKS